MLFNGNSKSQIDLRLCRSNTVTLDSLPLVWVDLFVLTGCLTFLQLPMLIDVKGIGKLSILPFIFVILKNIFLVPALSYRWARFINIRFRDIFNKNSTFVFALILAMVLVIADIRSLYAGISIFPEIFANIQKYLLIFLFLFSIWLTTPKNRINNVVVALLMSPGVLVLANIFLLVVGVNNQAADDVIAAGSQSSLLLSLGILSSRVVFPLTNGINGFGSLVGLALVLSVLGLISNNNKYVRLFSFFSAIGSLVAIAMVDSRGALIASAITLILIIYCKNFVKKYGFPLIVFFGILPFIILLVLPYLPISDLVNLISRQSSNDAGQALLTGRPLVWSVAWRELGNFSPLHFVGFGTHGQTISGASSYYGYQIGGGRHALMMHLHNFDIQTIFDVGYFGLILFFIFIRRILDLCRCMANNFSYGGYGLIAFFIYGGLQGATEAMPSQSYLEMYWFYVVLLIFLALGFNILGPYHVDDDESISMV